jgi:hypothetical protein
LSPEDRRSAVTGNASVEACRPGAHDDAGHGPALSVRNPKPRLFFHAKSTAGIPSGIRPFFRVVALPTTGLPPRAGLMLPFRLQNGRATREGVRCVQRFEAGAAQTQGMPCPPPQRGGRTLVTDGPFAETHKVLGGYYLILAEDRAKAVQFAQHPGARVGTVEVRPVFDVSGLRKSS